MNVCFLSFVIMSYILYPGNANFGKSESYCNRSYNSRVLVGRHSFSHNSAKDVGYTNRFPKFNYISKPRHNLTRNKWKKDKPRSKI